MKKLILILIAVMFALSVSIAAYAAPVRFTVIDGGDEDDDDYTYETIEDALEAIASGIEPDDDEEDPSDPEGFTEAEIYLTAPITLEDALVFDADGDYSEITNLTITGSNSTRITGSGEARHITIDNPSMTLTLRGVELFSTTGGGVLVLDGSFIAESTAFTRLDASRIDDDTDHNGGAIRVAANGTASIKDCTFTANKANNGGAIYLEAGSASFSGATDFSANEASSGGAIYVASGAVAVFSDTTSFETDRATENGGAIYSAGSLSFVNTPLFTNNTSTGDGGAIYSTGPMTFAGSPEFTGNTSGTDGGAISSSGALTFSTEATFTGNRARGNGGAISITNDEVNLTGVTFGGGSNVRQNSAVNGGAISITGGTATLTNCTFSVNSADNFGGAIYASSTVELGADNAITGNRAHDGGAVYLPETPNSQFFFDK